MEVVAEDLELYRRLDHGNETGVVDMFKYSEVEWHTPATSW